MNDIKHGKTKEILECFEQISKIPRCSKNEKEISEWLLNWAKDHNFETKIDKVRNIVIKTPGSPGYENSPTVVIQGHMDMVCEKTPDSPHDFSKDPIKFVYKEEWLTADRTTLGADNGIAIAMAMVLATDKDIPHPPLELLFTVDEETGLTGANNLAPGFIDGKILINVDSEDEGVFTVGCAGGINTNLTLPVEYETVPSGYKQYKITAGGMKGGHSGIDIGKGKANALRILARGLYQLKKQDIDVRIADIKGGSAHNAIPRDAYAIVFLPGDNETKAKDVIAEWSTTFHNEFKGTDPDLVVSITENNDTNLNKVITAAKTQKIIEFMLVIPHGVEAMSHDIDNLVETSNNFANLKLENDTLKVLTSQRSSVISRLHSLTARIESTARLAGGEAKSGDGYPPWQPNMDSPLLARSLKLYEKMFNKKPVVEVIHAGLECGIIGDRNHGMDMISIGPTLKFPHSPDEKIHIPSIGKVWDFVVELLKELK
ncbi:MAG: aminoacyl-histidine dipeptidase [Acidobacteria bacterium]|jgi:dipeptidase D|nr:aminoacyl-histidine dipeptidase [Acidobacteriota bacterium]